MKDGESSAGVWRQAGRRRGSKATGQGAQVHSAGCLRPCRAVGTPGPHRGQDRVPATASYLGVLGTMHAGRVCSCSHTPSKFSGLDLIWKPLSFWGASTWAVHVDDLDACLDLLPRLWPRRGWLPKAALREGVRAAGGRGGAAGVGAGARVAGGGAAQGVERRHQKGGRAPRGEGVAWGCSVGVWLLLHHFESASALGLVCWGRARLSAWCTSHWPRQGCLAFARAPPRRPLICRA